MCKFSCKASVQNYVQNVFAKMSLLPFAQGFPKSNSMLGTPSSILFEEFIRTTGMMDELVDFYK